MKSQISKATEGKELKIILLPKEKEKEFYYIYKYGTQRVNYI